MHPERVIIKASHNNRYVMSPCSKSPRFAGHLLKHGDSLSSFSACYHFFTSHIDCYAAPKNANLIKAKNAKNDEFYTQLTDIEKELRHYRRHFPGKTVFCNCDDPFESNFFKYFVLNFNRLGLKKLIATCYDGSPIAGRQLSLFDMIEPKTEESRTVPYKAVVTTVYDKTGDGGVDMLDVADLFRSGENELTRLDGNGDFRSAECLELLDESDIVVTNPPFSLFREYVAVLMEHRKHFIIIGNVNAITYKEIFPLLKENKLWIGARPLNHDMYFDVSDERRKWLLANKKEGSAYKIISGVVMGRLASACWYTNLDIKKRHEEMILVKRYTPEEYPEYDNYDAIEVSRTADIPCDYPGVMGVPITFMDKYCPEQFEIIGCADYTGKYGSDDIGIKRIGEKWIEVYRKNGGKGHYTANMTSLVYFDADGNARNTFKRILVRNKHPEPPKEVK